MLHSPFRSVYTLSLLLVAFLVSSDAIARPVSPALERAIANLKVTAEERDAGAVVLLRDVEVIAQDDGRFAYTSHIIVHVITDAAAADYGEFSVGFNSHYSEKSLDFARVLTASGEVKSLSPDAVQTVAPEQSGMFNDRRLLRFALPSVAAGTTLEFRVRTRPIRDIVPGHDYHTRYFHFIKEAIARGSWRVDPVRSARLRAKISSNRKLVFDVQGATVDPKIHTNQGSTTYAWTLEDLPALGFESGMPPASELLPSLSLSTMSSWASVDKWATSLFDGPMQPSASVRAKARDVTAKARTDRDKVAALFYYLQKNVRYIQGDVNRGGFTPHQAEAVLNSAYGDCKDQSVLLIALLRSIGLPAFPALIGYFPELEVNRNVPAPRFSHMIVYVPLASGPLWLDTSGRAGRFPGISWALKGREALVINGKGGQLIRLPRSRASDNVYAVNVEYQFDADGSVKADLELRPGGAFEAFMKSNFKHDPNAKKNVRNFVRELYSSATVRALDFSGADDDAEPVIVRASLDFPGNWTPGTPAVIGGSLDFVLGAFTDLLNLTPPEERTHDMVFNYPYRIEMRASAKAPGANYRHLANVPSAEHSSAAFTASRSIATINNGVTVRTAFELREHRVSQASYAAFHSDLSHARTRGDWVVRFTEVGGSGRGARPQSASSADEDIRAQDVRDLLERGEFEAARNLADRFARKNPNNGEAHFLLGLSLGFLDEYDESDAALEKAKALGHRE